jgi:hypothetical protein
LAGLGFFLVLVCGVRGVASIFFFTAASARGLVSAALYFSTGFRSGRPQMSTFVFINRDWGPVPEYYSTTDGIPKPDRNIHLDEVIKWAEADPIWAARGKAIQGYAQLEHALSAALSTLGGMTLQVAAAIFYKIVSTSARIAILEKLLHKKHGATYNPFWNGYRKELSQMDLKRNEIVHWLAAANMALDANNILHVGVTLMPPAQVGESGGDTPMITRADLEAFEKKCDELARLATMFYAATTPREGADPVLMQPWRDIFQQPFVYPLPTDHLLSQKQPNNFP